MGATSTLKHEAKERYALCQVRNRAHLELGNAPTHGYQNYVNGQWYVARDMLTNTALMLGFEDQHH
eukprot:2429518-Amphidinium_carterae.1